MGKKYNTVLSLKVNITDQTALSISIVHVSVLFGVYISSFCACVTEVSSCLLTDPNAHTFLTFLSLQAVWVQDPPHGLPAAAASSLQLQEPRQGHPLERPEQ